MQLRYAPVGVSIPGPILGDFHNGFFLPLDKVAESHRGKQKRATDPRRWLRYGVEARPGRILPAPPSGPEQRRSENAPYWAMLTC